MDGWFGLQLLSAKVMVLWGHPGGQKARFDSRSLHTSVSLASKMRWVLLLENTFFIRLLFRAVECRLYMGTNNLNQVRVLKYSRTFYQHPGYNHDSIENDVSFVRIHFKISSQ